MTYFTCGSIKVEMAGRYGARIDGGAILKAGIIAINPPQINPGTATTVSITLNGLRVGDYVVLVPPSNMDTQLHLAGASVLSDNTLSVTLRNNSVDPGQDWPTRNWFYLVVRR